MELDISNAVQMIVNKRHLPPTRSGLIRTALRDLITAEKAEEVTINMGTWHWGGSSPDEGDKCEVCLAGAVMRGMGVPDHINCYPSSFKEKGEVGSSYTKPLRKPDGSWNLDTVLVHLDELQAGCHSSLTEGLVEEEFLDGWVHYEEDAEAFKRWMSKVADMLEAIGD